MKKQKVLYFENYSRCIDYFDDDIYWVKGLLLYGHNVKEQEFKNTFEKFCKLYNSIISIRVRIVGLPAVRAFIYVIEFW